MFTALTAILDRIPIYNNTHAIRTIVVQRCETTLSWDQLRSPQVSQFLVKPIQQQIRAEHFSRGALYCLVANCLQFRKEGEANPGNVGVSKTRALLCELLAMRLLKEFSTRELIDALSYDYDPLQGLEIAGAAQTGDARGRAMHASLRWKSPFALKPRSSWRIPWLCSNWRLSGLARLSSTLLQTVSTAN